MKVLFEKWHGCQNDFIVIFSNPNQKELLHALKDEATKLSSREGSGIGANGILILEFEPSLAMNFAPSKLTIINQDGSVAKNCGNGIRCAALACYKRAHEHTRPVEIPDSFELTVEENKFLCHFSEEKNAAGLPHTVAVSVGIPRLNEANPWHEEALKAIEQTKTEFTPELQLESVTTCELSNPHIILITQQELNPEALDKIASRLQTSCGLDGVNVHLAREHTEIMSSKKLPRFLKNCSSFYDIIHWERGCGPTKACGTGASALAASIFAEGFITQDESIAVTMPGGSLCLSKRGEFASIELCGEAHFVFSGHLDI